GLLTTHMFARGPLQQDLTAARARAESVLASGAGLEKFRQLIERQGGDPSVVDDYARCSAPVRRETLRAPSAGYVTRIQAEEIGRASMLLGAGRTRVDAPIDYGAGIMLRAKPGDRVSAGDALADLSVGAHAQVEQALHLAASAYVIAAEPPAP